MSTLVKSKQNGFPSLRTMMEDFWNSDKFFDKSFFATDSLPAVNIRETENYYQVEVAAPGFKKEDFKIITENGLLNISAENNSEKTEKEENYTRREFTRSSFTRTFHLPENVSEDGTNAKYADGVLSIELKKSWHNLNSKKEVKVN